MKIILLQDVEGLGKAGDLKDVANGYARNYLLPRRLAAGATLGQVSLSFKARVGKQGRLYGSITSQDIAAGLRESEGIIVDRRMIDLPNPIRTIGTFMVPVKIGHKLEPEITVNVVDESASSAVEAESATAE